MLYYNGMSGINRQDVIHVAKLANLSLANEEIEKFHSQLSDIVGYIGELDEVDTSDVEPTSQCTGLENITRSDEIQPEIVLNPEEALSGTDNAHNGYFKVKAILRERKEK